MALWKLMPTLNEAAEALADEKLRGFINAHPELTENLGATAIQGHAVTDGDERLTPSQSYPAIR